MNAVEEFDLLVAKVQASGFRIRYDYFGGTGGGFCRFGGTDWLFIDLALSVTERLETLIQQMEQNHQFGLDATSRAA